MVTTGASTTDVGRASAFRRAFLHPPASWATRPVRVVHLAVRLSCSAYAWHSHIAPFGRQPQRGSGAGGATAWGWAA